MDGYGHDALPVKHINLLKALENMLVKLDREGDILGSMLVITAVPPKVQLVGIGFF